MRIGIDCRLAGQAHAGIGRYIENLITRLPSLAPEHEWVYFFHDQAQADEVMSSVENHSSVTVKVVPIRHYSLAEQTHLARAFMAEQLDLLHVPHFNVPLMYRQSFVVTIHDLLWHEYHGPHVTTLQPWQYWFKYAAYRVVARSAVTRAQKIFVPAVTIEKTLSKYFPQIVDKIVVTKEGVFAQSHRPQKNKKGSTPKLDKTLLYVGSLYPHKNVEFVAQALKKLPEYRLLVVGSRNVFQEAFRQRVESLGVSQQVELLGYKTDVELAQLYQQVSAVVQPSLSEGFGLTGVEAMAAGTPVLASHIPIFKEIYQDAAIFFDPHSADSFISAVRQLETTKREVLSQRGQKVVAQYSWDHMAEQTLAGYSSILTQK